MIYYSFAWECCPGEIYNKLLKMRIRLLHGQRGAPTSRGQALLQQPSTSPIRHELSWQPNPTSIDLLHFRMALARRVINSLFASIIDSTHPVASSAAIVPNAQLRLNGREVYRLLDDSYVMISYEEENATTSEWWGWLFVRTWWWLFVLLLQQGSPLLGSGQKEDKSLACFFFPGKKKQGVFKHHHHLQINTWDLTGLSLSKNLLGLPNLRSQNRCWW